MECPACPSLVLLLVLLQSDLTPSWKAVFYRLLWFKCSSLLHLFNTCNHTCHDVRRPWSTPVHQCSKWEGKCLEVTKKIFKNVLINFLKSSFTLAKNLVFTDLLWSHFRPCFSEAEVYCRVCCTLWHHREQSWSHKPDSLGVIKCLTCKNLLTNTTEYVKKKLKSCMKPLKFKSKCGKFPQVMSHEEQVWK